MTARSWLRYVLGGCLGENPRNADVRLVDKRRTALVINAYSHRNFGDAAIMLGTAELLAEAGVLTVISTRYHGGDREFYARRGIEVVDAVLPFAPGGETASTPRRGGALLPGLGRLLLLGGLTALGAPTATRRRLAQRWFPVLRRLALDDYVVMAGGGYLYSSRRRNSLTLAHAVAQAHLCRWAGIRVISMPQSIGPLTRRRDRRLVRSLRNLPLVLREVQSPNGLDLPAIRVPDVALMLRPLPGHPSRSDVLIVVMDWTWARAGRSASSLAAYVEKMARTADLLADAGLTVSLAGHCSLPELDQDDFAVARRVAAIAASVVPVLHLDDLDEALDAYAGSRFVFGTRLHSVLLALACGTPALALGYQPKSVGCLDEIGWPHVRDVESFTPDDAVRWITDAVSREVSLRRQATECCAEARRRLRAAYGVAERAPGEARHRPESSWARSGVTEWAGGRPAEAERVARG